MTIGVPIANLTRLGNLVRISTGKLDANHSSPDGKYPFFTCSREPLRIASYSYDCESVLVAGNGDLNVKYYNGKFDAYQRTYIIESLNKQTLNVRYLFHFMSVYVDQLRVMSVGGVIQYIKLGYLTEARIPLPSLPEQLRVAEVLDRAEALRAKRRAALAQIETLTQAIFFDMFGDPATNPKGWPRKALGNLITVGPQNGLYKPADDYGSGTPILRIDAFYDGVVTKLASLKRVRLSAQEQILYALREGEIVINRVNSREYLGKSALIPALSETTVFESNMMRFDVDREAIDPGYLIHYLQTGFIRKHILQSAKDAVNQSSINQQDVKAFPIIAPSLNLQFEFARRVAAINKLKAIHRASLTELDALFASIQHRAFRGEL